MARMGHRTPSLARRKWLACILVTLAPSLLGAQQQRDEPTVCLAIASWDFERVLRDEPGVALAVLKVVAARLREVTVDHRT